MNIKSFLTSVILLLAGIIVAQAPCNPALTSLLVSPNQATYCAGSTINFTLSATAPYASNVTWGFNGTANATQATGTNLRNFKITSVITGGTVTARGRLNPGTVCTYTRSFVVNVSQPIANAGADQLYISTPVNIGGSPCATNGVSPYTYNWQPGGATSCNITVSPSSTTVYTLTVTDAAGCQSTDMVTVFNINSAVSYIVPSKTIDGGYHLPKNNKVYFMFEEEYVAGTLNYQILDYNPASANVQVPNIACSLLSGSAKSLGDNRYAIDIPTCSPALGSGKYYVVELTNDKKEKFYFKFLN